MEKWILLAEWLSNKEEYEKRTQLFIDYKPTKQKITLPKEQTGWGFDQEVETEDNIGWHPLLHSNGKIYLIGSKPTEFELGLGTDSGFSNGPKTINQVCNLYASDTFRTESEHFTEKLFNTLPEHIKKQQRIFWLEGQKVEKEERWDVSSLYRVSGDSVKITPLHYSNGRDSFLKLSVLPILSTSAKIMVNIGDDYFDGSTIEKALKIKPPIG